MWLTKEQWKWADCTRCPGACVLESHIYAQKGPRSESRRPRSEAGSLSVAAPRLDRRGRLSAEHPAESPGARSAQCSWANAGAFNPSGRRPRGSAGPGGGPCPFVSPDTVNGGEDGCFLFRRRRAGGDPYLRPFSHSGMFPCFRGASVSRFVSSISSALISRGRVSRGSMTSST